MTLAEFKAWFEGFTEDMASPPNAKQWKRIKARVAQIDGVAVTREVIYRDRYWPGTITTWASTPVFGSAVGVGSVAQSAGNNAVSAGNLVDLGKAEYQSLAA